MNTHSPRKDTRSSASRETSFKNRGRIKKKGESNCAETGFPRFEERNAILGDVILGDAIPIRLNYEPLLRPTILDTKPRARETDETSSSFSPRKLRSLNSTSYLSLSITFNRRARLKVGNSLVLTAKRNTTQRERERKRNGERVRGEEGEREFRCNELRRFAVHITARLKY